MNLVLPHSVASSQDLSIVIRDVQAYAKWASNELIKQKVAGKSAGAQPEIASEAAEIIRTWSDGKPITQASLDDLLKALEEHKKTAPTITITLAAIPSGDVKAKLASWCRQELSPNVLVSFRLNRNILGGMVVSYGSHIHDWSFRRMLLEPKQQFNEVLASV